MNSELTKTELFDLEEIRNAAPIQVTYDYSRVTPEQADKLQVIYKRVLVRHMTTAYDDGKDLLEARAIQGLPYKEFIAWAKDCYGWGESAVNDKMNIALRWGPITPRRGVIDDHAMALLSTKATPEPARKEAKQLLDAGINVDEERAKEIRDRHKKEIEELKEANQELQRSFDLFKEDREKERQELKNKIQAVENEKAAKENEILNYKQVQAAMSNKPRLNEKELTQLRERLQNEAKQKLDEDLAKQRQEQKAQLKEVEKELKASYAQKEQQYQLKAENTIRSLLSHGIKSIGKLTEGWSDFALRDGNLH